MFLQQFNSFIWSHCFTLCLCHYPNQMVIQILWYKAQGRFIRNVHICIFIRVPSYDSVIFWLGLCSFSVMFSWFWIHRAALYDSDFSMIPKSAASSSSLSSKYSSSWICIFRVLISLRMQEMAKSAEHHKLNVPFCGTTVILPPKYLWNLCFKKENQYDIAAGTPCLSSQLRYKMHKCESWIVFEQFGLNIMFL